MLEISDQSFYFPFIYSLTTVTVFILISGFILKVLVEEKGKRNKIMLQLIYCIKNHENPEASEKIHSILKYNRKLINVTYGFIKNTPFLLACEMGATKVVQEMLILGANTKYKNIEGNGPMYFATYYLSKHLELTDASLVRTLYYCGCDINVKNNSGFTPLHLAAFFGHLPLIQWLLSKGAEIDIHPLPSGLALANGKTGAAYLLYKEKCKYN